MPADDAPRTRRERQNLAEVIDLRARLVPPPHAEPFEPSEEPPEKEVLELPDPREDGVKILARRALSARELRDRLLERGHPENDVETMIESFIDSHYLDDTSLARALSDKLRATKRASSSQIRRELMRRSIAPESIDEVLSEIDQDDEDALLWEVARDRARRLTSLDRATAERRLFGFLARRGWGGSSVAKVTSAVLDEALGRAR